jgi:hypothetical protein
MLVCGAGAPRSNSYDGLSAAKPSADRDERSMKNCRRNCRWRQLLLRPSIWLNARLGVYPGTASSDLATGRVPQRRGDRLVAKVMQMARVSCPSLASLKPQECRSMWPWTRTDAARTGLGGSPIRSKPTSGVDQPEHREKTMALNADRARIRQSGQRGERN